MENLNKENFFDQMSEQFPDAMKHFHKWLGEYKLKVNWNDLLCAAYIRKGEIDVFYEPIKFHQLPFEMQLGIIMKYGSETFNELDDALTPEGMKVLFKSVMEALQHEILKS